MNLEDKQKRSLKEHFLEHILKLQQDQGLISLCIQLLTKLLHKIKLKKNVLKKRLLLSVNVKQTKQIKILLMKCIIKDICLLRKIKKQLLILQIYTITILNLMIQKVLELHTGVLCRLTQARNVIMYYIMINLMVNFIENTILILINYQDTQTLLTILRFSQKLKMKKKKYLHGKSYYQHQSMILKLICLLS